MNILWNVLYIFNSSDYFSLHCLQILIKLSYMRIWIHRRPYKFTYESTFSGKRNIGKKKDLQCLGLIGTFIQLQLCQSFPFPSICLLLHVPSVPCAWRSVLCVLHWLHSWLCFPRALWDRGGRGSDNDLQAWEVPFLPPVQLERHMAFFPVFTEFFALFPWTSFEQRSWQAGRECSSEIFLKEDSDTEGVTVK